MPILNRKREPILLTQNHLLSCCPLPNKAGLSLDFKFKTGIYVLLIIVSGTILYYYIGSSVDIYSRTVAHLNDISDFVSKGSPASLLETTFASYDPSTWFLGTLAHVSIGVSLLALKKLEGSFITQFHTDKLLNTLIPNEEDDFTHPIGRIGKKVVSTNLETGVRVEHLTLHACSRFHKVDTSSIRYCIENKTLYKNYLKFELVVNSP